MTQTKQKRLYKWVFGADGRRHNMVIIRVSYRIMRKRGVSRNMARMLVINLMVAGRSTEFHAERTQ